MRFTERGIMTKGEMKKIVTLFMVLIMLVFAQANDSLPTSASSDILCYTMCAVQCSDLIDLEDLYLDCVSKCDLTCHKKPSKAAYDCITSCALSKSKSIDVKTGIYSYFYFSFFIIYWYQAIILSITMFELITYIVLMILISDSLSDARSIDAYVGSCFEACKNK